MLATCSAVSALGDGAETGTYKDKELCTDGPIRTIGRLLGMPKLRNEELVESTSSQEVACTVAGKERPKAGLHQ